MNINTNYINYTRSFYGIYKSKSSEMKWLIKITHVQTYVQRVQSRRKSHWLQQLKDTKEYEKFESVGEYSVQLNSDKKIDSLTISRHGRTGVVPDWTHTGTHKIACKFCYYVITAKR